mmetsp:Transcript_47007/g.147806  ORF Transcript_47007/g.147806 Transcript_47007/m.147806 type:complete len:215 (-) Transcript_47007:1914-2558(-)
MRQPARAQRRLQLDDGGQLLRLEPRDGDVDGAAQHYAHPHRQLRRQIDGAAEQHQGPLCEQRRIPVAAERLGGAFVGGGDAVEPRRVEEHERGARLAVRKHLLRQREEHLLKDESELALDLGIQVLLLVLPQRRVGAAVIHAERREQERHQRRVSLTKHVLSQHPRQRHRRWELHHVAELEVELARPQEGHIRQRLDRGGELQQRLKMRRLHVK